MRTVTFPQINKTFNVPECLAECNAKEFQSISYLIFQYLSGAIGYEEFRIHAITQLMNIKVSNKFQNDMDVMANVYLLSELVSNFFIDVEGKKQLDLNFIDIKIPKFKTILRTYHGPEDSFADITYGEYCEAQRFFNSFNASGDINFLYLLTAVFYRKRNVFTRKKAPYKSTNVEQRSNYFKRYVPLSIIYATYIQFLAFQNYLPSAEIDWNGNVLEFSILFEGDKSEDSLPGIGADSMVYTLAENGMLGDAQGVRNTNFWEVMVLMYELRKRDIDREKQERHVENK